MSFGWVKVDSTIPPHFGLVNPLQIIDRIQRSTPSTLLLGKPRWSLP